jgi:hypothetical protein
VNNTQPTKSQDSQAQAHQPKQQLINGKDRSEAARRLARYQKDGVHLEVTKVSLPKELLEDENYLDWLTNLLCESTDALEKVTEWLSPDSFKPLHGMRHGRARWIVAEQALKYYEDRREPIGKLLKRTILDYARNISLGAHQIKEIEDYVAFLPGCKPPNPQAIVENVQRCLQERVNVNIVRELNEQREQLAKAGTPDQFPNLAIRIAEQSRVVQAADPDAALIAAPQWPMPLHNDAFYGIAGEVVHLIEPCTEADPAALLAHFLLLTGNMFGHNGRFMVGATPHYTNLFVAIVGRTASGRKGTAYDEIMNVLKPVDEDWCVWQLHLVHFGILIWPTLSD